MHSLLRKLSFVQLSSGQAGLFCRVFSTAHTVCHLHFYHTSSTQFVTVCHLQFYHTSPTQFVTYIFTTLHLHSLSQFVTYNFTTLHRHSLSPTFLQHFSGSAMIVLRPRDLQDVLFTCDSSLHRGGATCFDEYIIFAFPSHIEELALHMNALELFVLIMAVNVWAPRLTGSRFQISCHDDAAVQAVLSCRSRMLSCSVVSDNFSSHQLAMIWPSCDFAMISP